MLDLVFSLLRTVAPTANEIAEAERSLKVLQALWLNLGFNITPKAHILFYHTLEQFKNYDGIADKVEDFVEKAHQQGKKMEHIVSRMPKQCYIQQQQTIFKRIWTDCNPEVEKQKAAVHKQSRRKRKAAQPKENATRKKKNARKRRRDDTVQSAFFLEILRNLNETQETGDGEEQVVAEVVNHNHNDENRVQFVGKEEISDLPIEM